MENKKIIKPYLRKSIEESLQHIFSKWRGKRRKGRLKKSQSPFKISRIYDREKKKTKIEENFMFAHDFKNLKFQAPAIVPPKQKSAGSFDLNVVANRGFDLNKFPEEEEETTFEHEEVRKIIRIMLKIYLHKFY
ncbi:hypothetical protein ACP275_03G031300 [Erythranthe tilingii]